MQKIEKKVEETKIAENADYAREKCRQRGYKTQVVFEAVMHMLLVITGGLVVYRLSDEQADELERKCKEIFPKPESNVSDYVAFALNNYRKVQKS